MAVGDVYQVVHKMRDGDAKSHENVYFYVQDWNPIVTTTPTARRLAEDWRDEVLPTFTQGLPSFYATSAVNVKNLFDDADAYDLGLNLPGTLNMSGTEPMPAFTNSVTTLATDNASIRKGRKSFLGLRESDQISGTLTSSGLSIAAAKGAACLLYVTGAALGAKAFRPCVVKRVKYETESGVFAYRLPINLAEKIIGSILSAVTSALVSSMVSRKV